MAPKGWYEALSNALQKEDSAAMQLATIDSDGGFPRVRSMIQRSFVTASALPHLPLILTTTDILSPKVTQLVLDRRVELVYWFPSTQEQFRILGHASIVPHPKWSRPYPGRTGTVYEQLAKEGFDWEKRRVETFDAMSGHMKATWCRSSRPPGTPLGESGDEEMKKWPERLPKLGEAESEEDKDNLTFALSRFALLLVEPFEVDYIELGVQPDRRTRFERDWEDENVVEFKATMLVP